MKKIILTIAAIVLVITGVFAQKETQQKRTPEQRAEKSLERMKRDLDLSDDQVTKLRPVIIKREEKRDELLVKMDTLKSSTRKVMKEAEEDFKKILTSDQMQKLKAERSALREKRKSQPDANSGTEKRQ